MKIGGDDQVVTVVEVVTYAWRCLSCNCSNSEPEDPHGTIVMCTNCDAQWWARS